MFWTLEVFHVIFVFAIGIQFWLGGFLYVLAQPGFTWIDAVFWIFIIGEHFAKISFI
jgi:hypothetical protein